MSGEIGEFREVLFPYFTGEIGNLGKLGNNFSLSHRSWGNGEIGEVYIPTVYTPISPIPQRSDRCVELLVSFTTYLTSPQNKKGGTR